jgi:hypothetical protein
MSARRTKLRKQKEALAKFEKDWQGIRDQLKGKAKILGFSDEKALMLRQEMNAKEIAELHAKLSSTGSNDGSFALVLACKRKSSPAWWRPEKAPDFSLPSAEGKEMALHDFAGRKVLLVFTQSGCSPCTQIVPELNRLGSSAVQVVVIHSGDLEAIRCWDSLPS